MSLGDMAPERAPAPAPTAAAAAAIGASKRRKKKSRKEKEEAEEARRQRLLRELDGAAAPQLPTNVTVEYVEQKPAIGSGEFAEYETVFAQFASNAAKSFGAGDETEDEDEDDDEQQGAAPDVEMATEDRHEGGTGSSAESELSDDDQSAPKASRKQKRLNRITVAELKQRVSRPEVVEWTDTSAQDPELLIALKSAPNTVPVPVHWSQKKKYLQYKRGMEKPPFELPEFIRATGIMEMREAAVDDKATKATARERMRPKMNRLNLDYQRLHDAFFRFQTPPPNMTGHGDLFYEGKESDTTYSFTPGMLSDELKEALNIPPLAPPPWLINMQRHGLPPSYPSLPVPGLNAPIPKGAQWGYHPGGWGRPPVDEFGRPLFGDVFSDPEAASVPASVDTAGPRKYWGDLEINESSDEESEEEDDEAEESEGQGEDAGPADATASAEPAPAPAAAVEPAELTDDQLRSGLASMPSGLETPSVIQLRKQAGGTANQSLYTILPEQETARLEGIMGSQFTYDMSKALDPSKKQGNAGGRKAKPGGVDIALDASELEGMDEDMLREKYEEAESHRAPGEDLSDMVADHVAAQARKRKTTAAPSSSAAAAPKKKPKGFKF
ncbi:hypothetical protein LPJ61_002302 [Coemansia biformis]|uniref:PSP proline-rich domain-containing protein n=1 Tax=Coemansia biformis TaxID=1286918 RepID=A0A9W7YG30_9FUNG|nr:hypothetical protein LPJ61_002302 [Coemansia biformis]